jgi:hypothetical protein
LGYGFRVGLGLYGFRVEMGSSKGLGACQDVFKLMVSYEVIGFRFMSWIWFMEMGFVLQAILGFEYDGI